MPAGWAVLDDIRKNVTTPAGVIRPIFGPYSNQKLPSGPSVSAPPVGIVFTSAPVGLTTLTGNIGGSSPNPVPRDTHRFPSRPVVSGRALRSVGSGNSFVLPIGTVAAPAGEETTCADPATASTQTTAATNLPIR